MPRGVKGSGKSANNNTNNSVENLKLKVFTSRTNQEAIDAAKELLILLLTGGGGASVVAAPKGTRGPKPGFKRKPGSKKPGPKPKNAVAAESAPKRKRGGRRKAKEVSE